jgi:hypothetical protein
VFVQGPDSAVDNEPTVADVEVVELEALIAPGRASRARIAAVVDVGLAAVNATAVDDIEEFLPVYEPVAPNSSARCSSSRAAVCSVTSAA